MSTTIAVMRVEGSDPAVPLPSYETEGAAGADVRANIPDGSILLEPGARKLVPTGLRFEIPQGFEIQVRPRSGLALRHGLTLVNSPGTIDSDYRGEVGIIILNTAQETFEITHGMRLAQLVLAPVTLARFSLATDLGKTERGAGGFGSTGGG